MKLFLTSLLVALLGATHGAAAVSLSASAATSEASPVSEAEMAEFVKGLTEAVDGKASEHDDDNDDDDDDDDDDESMVKAMTALATTGGEEDGDAKPILEYKDASMGVYSDEDEDEDSVFLDQAVAERAGYGSRRRRRRYGSTVKKIGGAIIKGGVKVGKFIGGLFKKNKAKGMSDDRAAGMAAVQAAEARAPANVQQQQQSMGGGNFNGLVQTYLQQMMKVHMMHAMAFGGPFGHPAFNPYHPAHYGYGMMGHPAFNPYHPAHYGYGYGYGYPPYGYPPYGYGYPPYGPPQGQQQQGGQQGPSHEGGQQQKS